MAQPYRSITSQSLHYYSRPHSGMPSQPLDTPAAWDGRELQSQTDWQYHFSDGEIAECEAAIAAAKATGKSAEALTAADFPLPTLARRIADWRRELQAGRGFVLLRGIPAERWGQADCELFFWCLGWHLGLPGAQNRFGELLGHVRDTGADPNDPTVREYRTAVGIRFHCDNADVVGLMCLKTAKSGGESRIASSVSIFNRLLQEDPVMAARVFEPVMLDARAEGGLRWFPVKPSRYYRGELRTFWHSGYFESAARYPEVGPLDATLQTLIARYDALADELALDMELAPGDIQLCSNHSIVHSRAAYQDHDDPDERRHLLRLWLSLPQPGDLGWRSRRLLSRIALLGTLLKAKWQQRNL